MPIRPLILFVASEIYPFSKTGGLGDVLGALPLTLHRLGINVGVITPLYGRLKTADIPLHLMYSDCPVGYPWPPNGCDVYLADFHGMPVYFIHREEYFDRRFYYNNYKGDYFDNCERFIFFARAALELSCLLATPPSIIHVHDWQTGLVPAYLHQWRHAGGEWWANTKSVMTIHNLAFQGRFSSRLFEDTGLPEDVFWHMNGVEFHGDLNLLKAGIAYADKVTTVSPSYAEEIVSPAFGCGLEGILGMRQQDLIGILNGADYDVWDPSQDKYLPATYSVDDLDGKQACKKEVLEEFCLDMRLMDRPLLGFIGRLRGQKGIDLLIDILPELMKLDVGVVVLGEGKLEHEQAIMGLMEDYLGRLSARVGYTEDLAHRIQAGADIFLMPSKYEPCGLTQMYALRYGTPPVATAVGGLRDTITPWPHPEATGFTFPIPQAHSFLDAVREAVSVWEDRDKWAALRDRAMRQDFSWVRSAMQYIDVYRELGADI